MGETLQVFSTTAAAYDVIDLMRNTRAEGHTMAVMGLSYRESYRAVSASCNLRPVHFRCRRVRWGLRRRKVSAGSPRRESQRGFSGDHARVRKRHVLFIEIGDRSDESRKRCCLRNGRKMWRVRKGAARPVSWRERDGWLYACSARAPFQAVQCQ